MTERVLNLAGDHTIRPDNAIVSDDQIVIFETEGAAGASQRPRLLDKALSWNAAASALRKVNVDLRVRVLINQKPGRDLDHTLEVWAQSLAVAQNTVGKPLDVQFWGRALPKFLKSPNWNSLDGFIRLDDPARVADFGLSPAQAKAFDAPFQATDLLPNILRRQPVAYERDRARLRAHARYFARHLLPEIPPFSPDFFDLVREIHTVAFSDSKGARDVANILSIPIVALMMLRTYIRHYPDLHQALFQSWRNLNNARGAMVTTQAAYRLVITFLDFHGLRHDHPACQIRVSAPDLYGNGISDFSVHVHLHLPCPIEVSRSQWRNFEEETEKALAWVLQMLLDYPEILEITHSPNSNSTRRRKK
ncbi:MAG: hypothetical protein U9R15_14355 [Chloroflexota bacterium]|nr:hypothetical protein [Chloroflexota bacterium]